VPTSSISAVCVDDDRVSEGDGVGVLVVGDLGVGHIDGPLVMHDHELEEQLVEAGCARTFQLGDGFVAGHAALTGVAHRAVALGIAIGAGTDVAIETADVVLMRSDPLGVPTALRIGRATVHKEHQNLGWAIGYNALALPIAAGALYAWLGLWLRPEIAALTMSGSTLIVTANALLLRRLHLPETS
jgi:hypothetical protein